MAKEMLINVSEGEECRIALLEDGKLEELYMERTSSTSHVGNIYKGRVTNVEPSIQAAFVDFGLGRNGFLHITDLLPQYFGEKGDDFQESVGHKLGRRDRPPIQRCLRRGDEVIVQIIKEGIGTKGPTLSTYLSVPGRILVMMPGMSKLGVSRKIEDDEERRRLRQILDSLKPPKDVGFIIRTAGVGKSKLEIERDLKYLTRLWENFEKQRASGPSPMELYQEGDLVTRTVRDVFTSDVERIVIDNKEVADRVKDFIKIAMPRTRNRVELYEEPVPLFHHYGIEREIERMYSRYVPLPSGGSLVIDSTEAIVAIDVNSGKFREHSDAEMTAFKTDMEAADEIPRQLKLRDLGGVIICDFIDLRFERHRRELEKRLDQNFRRDRAKTKVLSMSQFGIIELTRQRMRPSLKRSIYADCPHCKGAGLVKTTESMGLDVTRRLAIALNDERVARVELAVCPEVSFYLQNKKRQQLAHLEKTTGKRLIIAVDQTIGLDQMRLDLYDSHDALVIIDELSTVTESPTHKGHTAGHPSGSQGRSRRGGRGRNGDRQQQNRHQPSREMTEAMDERPDRDADTVQQKSNRPESLDEEESGAETEARDSRQPSAGRPNQPAASTTATSDGNNQQRQGGQEGESGGRRRRRRRGRRGRGGRGQASTVQASESSPLDDATDEDSRDPMLAHSQPDHDMDEPRNFDELRDSDESRSPDEPFSDVANDSSDHVEVESDMDSSSMSDQPAETDEGEDGAVPAAQAGEPDGALPDESPVAAAAESAPPKTRRRSRSRSRRKSTSKAMEETAQGASEPSPESMEEEEASEPIPARTSRRRGGRRTRRAAGDKPAKSTADSAAATPATSPEPAEPQARIAEKTIATARTSVADRHLASDEPVEPQPISRPRTYRDLDDIPDDFD